MIREIVSKHIGGSEGFRNRGIEPGRLENFSDAVFALAITLLLISTSPPVSFQQVKRFVFDLLPFAICIALILAIWYQHFEFFYRYGLRSGRVVFLNTVFLVIVLFYVYPLKFLAKLSLIPLGVLLGKDWLVTEIGSTIHPQDIGDLMIIYGIGAMSAFFTLMLLYRHALSQAKELELNKVEMFDTRVSIRTNFLMGLVPLVSVLFALLLRGYWQAGMVAGFAYFLYTPVMMIHGAKSRKKRDQLIAQLKEADVNS
ncbi:MAG: DUF1211 domain-containing protein [Cyclobacteriaceae bacterium]|nr:DUF1211 domain-containing protein [Cyclobacteriaceae bacterium]